MRTFTMVAAAAIGMWFVSDVNAQQDEAPKAQGQKQIDGQKGKGFGQGGPGQFRQGKQGQGRRGNRRGMQQGQGKGQGQGRGQGRRGGAQMMEFLFQRFDKDQDGSISMNEAPDRMKQRFDRLDTDGNKSVSKEEMRAAFEKMGQGQGQGKGKGQGRGQGMKGGKGQGKQGGKRGQMDPAMMIKRMDKNNDGVLSIDEAPEKMKQRFDRLDADGNGSVTADEFKAAFEKMKKGKDGQIGRNKSADPNATKPVKPKRPPMANDGA